MSRSLCEGPYQNNIRVKTELLRSPSLIKHTPENLPTPLFAKERLFLPLEKVSLLLLAAPLTRDESVDRIIDNL